MRQLSPRSPFFCPSLPQSSSLPVYSPHLAPSPPQLHPPLFCSQSTHPAASPPPLPPPNAHLDRLAPELGLDLKLSLRFPRMRLPDAAGCVVRRHRRVVADLLAQVPHVALWRAPLVCLAKQRVEWLALTQRLRPGTVRARASVPASVAVGGGRKGGAGGGEQPWCSSCGQARVRACVRVPASVAVGGGRKGRGRRAALVQQLQPGRRACMRVRVQGY
eukprot:355497-Chlamydomonas_euryale.AAC.2